jgi:hypothetical protein
VVYHSYGHDNASERSIKSILFDPLINLFGAF